MNPNSHPSFTNHLLSSISSFVNSSDLFPSADRRIGLTVTCGYHPEHKRVMVLVNTEQPSFISTSTGEYLESDKAESTIRQTCTQLAATCRKQAKELIQHAERLEKLANSKQPLIDTSKIDKDSDHDVIIVSTHEKKKQSNQRSYQSPPRPLLTAIDIDDI